MLTLKELKQQARAMVAPLAAGVGTRRIVATGDASGRSPARKGEFRVAAHGGSVEMGVIDQYVMLKDIKGQEWVRDLQAFNDDVLVMSQLLKCDARELNYYKERMHKGAPLRKQMDTQTATEGLEWVPTNYSAEWVRFVDLKLQLAALFRGINMPSDPYKIPFQNGQATVYFLTEQTGDAGTKLTATSVASANFQLDAKKIAARIPFSTELTEDSIVPILAMLREELAHAVARGVDDCILNGDTSASHQDNDVTAATDRRKAWDGLRKQALGAAARYMSLSTFSTANLGKLRSLMGKYGVAPSELAWIIGPKVYARHFMTLAEVLTVEKYGANATILNGELGKLFGIPLIVVGVAREDLNTAGVKDSTTTDNGQVILAHRPSWFFGTKRQLELKLWENIEYDQMYLTGTCRHDFATPWTSDPVAVAGNDVDLS